MINLNAVEHIVLSSLNRLHGIRDSVYLDTNAWSMLAKGEVSVEPLVEWVRKHNYYIWIARFQLAELTAKKSIMKRMADILEKVGVIVLDRGQEEFNGQPWNQVKVVFQQHIQLKNNELKEAFVTEMTSSAMARAREQVKNDGKNFQKWLEEELDKIHNDPRSWKSFPERVKKWITQQLRRNGWEPISGALDNPCCYAGLRLSYAVLFLRYFLNRQRWRSSDYVDYLHAADMAYAKVVVTEKNLCECLLQVSKRRELCTPDAIFNTSWLSNPK